MSSGTLPFSPTLHWYGVLLGEGDVWLAGHLVTTLPYVIIVVSARLEGLDPAVEEAARSLGAGRWRTLASITAPLALPAIVAGALMAFMVSFDNFIISYFLSPPDLTTLPMRIYQSIRLGYTPDMNAIATLILAASFVVVVAGERLLLRGTLLQGRARV